MEAKRHLNLYLYRLYGNFKSKSMWSISNAPWYLECFMNTSKTYVQNFNAVVQKLIPYSRVLFEKIIVIQPVKKFPAFYRTTIFIHVFTTARD